MPEAARKYDSVSHSAVQETIEKVTVVLIDFREQIIQGAVRTKQGKKILLAALIRAGVVLGREGFDDLLKYLEKKLIEGASTKFLALHAVKKVFTYNWELFEHQIEDGSPNVIINHKYWAAREDDPVFCDKGHKSTLQKNESSVIINGKCAIRLGDVLGCGAIVTGGSNNVFFDEMLLQAKIAELKQKAEEERRQEFINRGMIPPEEKPIPTENVPNSIPTTAKPTATPSPALGHVPESMPQSVGEQNISPAKNPEFEFGYEQPVDVPPF